MNSRTTCLLIAASLTGGVSIAQATPLGERSSFGIFVGGDAMSGSFHGLSHASPQSGEIAFAGLDFADAYDHRYTAGAEFDYAIGEQASAFARFGYSQFDGVTRNVANYFPDEGRVPISASFGDTTTRELSLGARYTFVPGASFRPFVGLSLGAARLSPLRATVDNVITGGTTPVELAREDTVFEQRAETGLQFSPLRNFDMRFTVAAEHVDGQRASDDPNLALIGLSDAHDDMRAHWEYPAELGAVWHF